MATSTLRNVDPAQGIVELDSGRRLNPGEQEVGSTTTPLNAAALAGGLLRDVGAAPPVPAVQQGLARVVLTDVKADDQLAYDPTVPGGGAFRNRTPQQLGGSGIASGPTVPSTLPAGRLFVQTNQAGGAIALAFDDGN